jgi:glutaredoxin
MPKVLMYTLSTCPWCRKTKQFFKDKNIPFDFVDYDVASDEEQDRIVADMRKHTSHISFPYVVIDDKVVQGYNPDKYEELINKAGGK